MSQHFACWWWIVFIFCFTWGFPDTDTVRQLLKTCRKWMTKHIISCTLDQDKKVPLKFKQLLNFKGACWVKLHCMHQCDLLKRFSTHNRIFLLHRLDYPDLWRRRRQMREIHKRIRFTAGFCKYSQLLAFANHHSWLLQTAKHHTLLLFPTLWCISRCFDYQLSLHNNTRQFVWNAHALQMHQLCFFFITTWSTKECPRSKAHSAAGCWPVFIKLELNQNLSNILGVPEVIS